eukprot:5572869-Pyramimonas_sp.AAC.1
MTGGPLEASQSTSAALPQGRRCHAWSPPGQHKEQRVPLLTSGERSRILRRRHLYTTTVAGQGHPGPWHGASASWPMPGG